jgi:XTP/dITP diphosphohydrolase
MAAPPVPTLVLATRNAHKLAEVSRMLAPFGLAVEGLPDPVVLPPEDGATYEENALGKARAAAAALGRDVIADDSGIEAAALDGRPGIRSARFAGEHASDGENLALLVASAPEGSGLQYMCCVAYVSGAGTEHTFFGASRGRLLARPRGERGFGYDPAFIPEGPAGVGPDGLRTMAELTDAEKDAISHRGRAVRSFAEWFIVGAGPVARAGSVGAGGPTAG